MKGGIKMLIYKVTNIKNNKVYAVGGSFMMKGDIVDNCKKINEML